MRAEINPKSDVMTDPREGIPRGEGFVAAHIQT